MYYVYYVIDEHDRLYGPSRRRAVDLDQAKVLANYVGAIGIYDEDGKLVQAPASQSRSSESNESSQSSQSSKSSKEKTQS